MGMSSGHSSGGGPGCVGDGAQGRLAVPQELWLCHSGSACHLEVSPLPHIGEQGARLSVWCEEGNREERRDGFPWCEQSPNGPVRREEVVVRAEPGQWESHPLWAGERWEERDWWVLEPPPPTPACAGRSPPAEGAEVQSLHALGAQPGDRCPPVAEGQWAPNPNPNSGEAAAPGSPRTVVSGCAGRCAGQRQPSLLSKRIALGAGQAVEIWGNSLKTKARLENSFQNAQLRPNVARTTGTSSIGVRPRHSARHS